MIKKRSHPSKRSPRAQVLHAVWWLLVLGSLGLFVILIPINFRATRISIEVEQMMALLHPYVSIHSFSIYLVSLRYLAAAVFFAAGALIYWRCRDDWVAVIFSLLLFLLPVGFNLGSNVEIISPTDPRGSILAAASGVLAAVSWICFILLLFVFPDGRAIPAWTLSRTVLAMIGGAGLILLLSLSWSTVNLIFWAALLPPAGAVLILIAGGVGGQIHRYRTVSSSPQRQQTKLVVAGLLAYLQWELGPWWWWLWLWETPLTVLVSVHLDLLFPLLLPIAVVFSILRFRLWDIDVIIRRTLIYGALTATLAAVYFGIVVLLQQILPAQTQLTTVLSTLTIAGLFSPLRRRIQRDIDRRFYRRKYDTEFVLAAFSSKLRSEVDLDQLQESILGVVEESLQPASASLWMCGVRQPLAGEGEPEFRSGPVA